MKALGTHELTEEGKGLRPFAVCFFCESRDSARAEGSKQKGTDCLRQGQSGHLSVRKRQLRDRGWYSSPTGKPCPEPAPAVSHVCPVHYTQLFRASDPSLGKPETSAEGEMIHKDHSRQLSLYL